MLHWDGPLRAVALRLQVAQVCGCYAVGVLTGGRLKC